MLQNFANVKKFSIIFLIFGFIFILSFRHLEQEIHENSFRKINSSKSLQKIIRNISNNFQKSFINETTIKFDIPCGKFPSVFDLNITDSYWQVTTTRNGTFYLYNAYYDDRLAIDGRPVIRILGMINVIRPTVKTFCQFWYENMSQPLISPAYEYRYIWSVYWGENKKGATPYLISCRSKHPGAPKYVSLVENQCGTANNLMKVRNKRIPRRNFIVSVKKLDYDEDISMQIIEWCEILKILGIDKVEIFVLKLHENVLNVLKFYESEDFVRIKFLKYPSDLPNALNESWHQYVQNELIAYHDTFYENLYSYEFLVPMDSDEFILPLNSSDRTWKDLITRTIKRSKEAKKITNSDCFPVENHYFLLKTPHRNETIPGIPKDLYFLHSVYRAANFTPAFGNVKTFMRMDRVLTIHNHLPFSCLDKSNGHNCLCFQVSREDGQLSHYRHDCLTDECKASIDEPERDESLWKYKNEILMAVKEAITKIRKFSDGKIDLNLEE